MLWAQWEDNSTHPSLPYSAITLQIGCLGQFLKLHPLQKRNMCMKVSDMVLPLNTYNWFEHYLWDIYRGFGHNGKIIQRTPFPPILSHHAPNWLPGPVFETSHTSRKKHGRESLRHSVTTHNWFGHYPWDIYGGFGHNGKIIQRTLPSHTQPSRSKLAAWASFRNLTHFGRETCV